MAQVIADRRDVDFVLYEQLQIEKLTEHEKYKDLNKKTFDLVINEARNFAVKEILPTLAESDTNGARFENGTVKVPESYHSIYKSFCEGDWIAMCDDPEVGGQGMPITIGQAALDYMIGASFAFVAYGMCGHGTGKMIEIFGTDKQKNLYLSKLYSGEWGGTMVLTEPEAGSDVGNLTTSATKNPDGTYSITGNKIFITNGDQDLTENIIHPVLARIEGAPKGSKGISLFIVPKFWVNDDGSLGEKNDVVCTGIEEKMGLHGSATCALSFGSKGTCKGVLLGEENKGMRVMFHMMNEMRLAVGIIGLCNASCAYLYALDYARTRKQGRDLSEFLNHEAPPVPIIHHPDVRRMLMWMKVHVEGMRSLIYFVADCFDKELLVQDENEKSHIQGLIEILTPIVKSYCTDRGFDACSQAIQVHGGYGYTKDFPVEQLLRDSKINSIYEGTNGIQAMDLLGRKLGMKKGAVFMGFLEEMKKTVTRAKNLETLKLMGEDLEKTVDRLAEIAMQLGQKTMSDMKAGFAHATPFLEAMGDICMAWMLLWRACVAQEKLSGKPRKKDVDFYEGQIKSAGFFFNTILPITHGKMNAISKVSPEAIEISEAAFGG
ncbi:MAG: acyl-CoA dehydrogenase domain-containing protein [Candidatus Magnetoglobus multicellularis str. Araruama]|uniref:3-methylmercaptopropionyl-CoA dehydrogenase n=1 Tax=Candidatus Magnetoglobus multicellularis str. Araruama TaxID=890399 RepID=A0A1V1PBU8_9BACT|nr:MAG: acyl-CoA dehydrogenase domain-containing protein [Candidatus Magnetoglobus multicellularis str. Araruama]